MTQQERLGIAIRNYAREYNCTITRAADLVTRAWDGLPGRRPGHHSTPPGPDGLPATVHVQPPPSSARENGS